MTPAESQTLVKASLEARIVKTLDIANRWGYGLSDAQLADLLYGGPVSLADVRGALQRSTWVVYRDGYAALAANDHLIDKSLERGRSNGLLSDLYFGIAEAFARDLLRHSPFVRTVAVSGSAASEGIGHGDDVDVNLFVEDGSKYIVYVTALLLGLKYSIAFRRRFAAGASFFGLIPKVTCVNVVWTESDCRPFARTDEYLAYEILRSVPVAGTAYFAEVVAANPWLAQHFPQVQRQVHANRVPTPTPSIFARVQRRIARSPRGRRLLDGAGRALGYAAYRIVELSRVRDAEAAARHAFLQKVKWPYEVFQD